MLVLLRPNTIIYKYNFIQRLPTLLTKKTAYIRQSNRLPSETLTKQEDFK